MHPISIVENLTVKYSLNNLKMFAINEDYAIQNICLHVYLSHACMSQFYVGL